MNVEKINNSGKQPKILVIPLDWGLGHATRCIPVIKTLIDQNVNVVLAGDGPVELLLQKEFPDLKFLKLDGYNVKYSRRKWLFSLTILTQIPSILRSVNKEHDWLSHIINTEKIDAVISDNRPGLYNKKIPSVYITHQLQIQTGSTFFNTILQKIHYRFINKFNCCWVPDDLAVNLAGNISMTKYMPRIPVKYIGILSRMKLKHHSKKIKFLLLVSGPEPQRSIFEMLLLNAFDPHTTDYVLIRGLPQKNKPLSRNFKGIIIDHLPADELSRYIEESEIVICRAGYSSIMDLVVMRQKAILVATPGQTEQEYLAKHLGKKNIFKRLSQSDISYEAIITKAGESFENMPDIPANNLDDVIKDLINQLKK